MEQSILKSTKKMLLIGDDDESFDLNVITNINSAFSTLNDLGVGPPTGFMIEDEDAEWDEFVLEDDPIQLSRVKTFVFLQVRLLFDPPNSSYLLQAIEKQIAEETWRLSTRREGLDWEDPDPPVEVDPV